MSDRDPRINISWMYILRSLVKPKTIKQLTLSTKRELRKNGIKGVLKKARGLFSSPFFILAYSFDRLYKMKTLNNHGILPEFRLKEGMTSVVIPFVKDGDFIPFEKIRSIADGFRGDVEVVGVASGYGQNCPEMLERALSKERMKIFSLPAKYSMERLLAKGAKEASGENICFIDPERLFKEGNESLNAQGFPKLVKNDKSLREKLSQKIAYVVPNVGISGGLSVVLQHSNRLLEKGYDTAIISLNPISESSWFSSNVPVIEAGTQKKYLLDNIDVLIATHWTTVLYVHLLPARRKLYFVQSDERRFNPTDEKDVRAIEATYRSQCEYMTEAIWIQRWLREEFGHEAYYVPNGIDLDIFHKAEPLEAKKNVPRVLIEGGIDFWYKGMDDAYDAVKDLEVEIWIVSSQGKPRRHWRYDRFFENVPIEEMRRIYSSCDVFLKMSKVEGFFGPPMEAMACGCPVVVCRVTGYDEYIEDGKNALVVDAGDMEGAGQAVTRLIADKMLRQKLVQGGYETVRNWSWERSISLLEKVIQKQAPEAFYTGHFPKAYSFDEWKLSLAA